MYVRIPGKGIALYRLLWGGDDNTSEISIGNVLNKKIMFDLIKSGMEVNSGRGNDY